MRLTKGPKGYAASATAGPGRTGIVFGTQTRDKSIWVFPSDTVSLIASGKLDKRLFDVTELAENGYGDDKRATTPLIVQHTKGKPMSGKPAGATVDRELASAGATAVRENKQTAVAFWTWLTRASNVKKVWLDGRVKASLDRSVPQIGAPGAWQKDYTGKGVKVAVLDTGIDTTHLDLKGAVAESANFTDSPTTIDNHGHGTHVASIITGDGARSAGKYKGVAPDAVLLNGKVLNDGGGGFDSWIIAGMEWAVARDASVVNMSIGGSPNEGTGPVELALNELSRSSGTLFVVAAGNTGPGRYSVNSPATATEALSVAATNRNQTTAGFSSAGPRRGDFAVKPEIAAPGADIVAARAAGTWGDGVGDHYVKASGTSMATPHVAGAAAILAQQQPTWNARVLKAALMGTAKLPVNESVFRQGAGFLDVSGAVTQKVFALEGSVSANLRWPQAQKVVRTITYRNPGATPLMLNLGFKPKDQNGMLAAAGVFTLQGSVTVPPRTTAKVTLTVDPARSRPGLQYQGRINATAGGIVVRTPVSVNVEQEAYDVVLNIIDRNGTKVTDFDHGQLLWVPFLINLTNNNVIELRFKDGVLVGRIPRGAYTTYVQVITTSPENGAVSTTLMSLPRFTVTAPVTLTLDARAGKHATAVVDATGVKTYLAGATLMQQIGDVIWGTGVDIYDSAAEPAVYVVGTPPVSRPFRFLLTQGLSTSEKTYELVVGDFGRLPDNPTYPVADRDLADLSVVLGAQGVREVGNSYIHEGTFAYGDVTLDLVSAFQVSQPSTRRHLVSATALGAPITWFSTLRSEAPDGQRIYTEYGGPTLYEAGKRYVVKLNTAAFTPQGGAFSFGLDNSVRVEFSPFGSSAGDSVFASRADRGDIVLKRNGITIAESPSPDLLYHANVAAGTATYTAIMHANRDVPWSVYGPRSSGTWTFNATIPPGQDMAVLPLISTAVSGDFDGWGRAPAGQAFPLTLNVKGTDGGVATATARVSYNDGKTWTTVPVSNANGEWVATVNHPDVASAFVSLRVIITDTQGNSGGWTAYRSYQITQLD